MSVDYDHICRLCLSSRGDLLPIFSSTSSSKPEPHVLASKILECVSVEISEDDILPTQVCRKCYDNVNNWHIFKKICDQSQNKLKTWIKDDQEKDHVKGITIKKEPEHDASYNEEVIINASYSDFDRGNDVQRLQPEGPPILTSLGLAPRNEKCDSEKDLYEPEEDEEESDCEDLERPLPLSRMPQLPSLPEVSVTVMRRPGTVPLGAGLGPFASRQNIQQLASKSCLLCHRSYRYSHNARRHELAAHKFDRYTNKIQGQKPPKLRPNPFNPKARLMPNPINPKIQMMPKALNKQSIQIASASSIPLRIKALADLQIKKKEPEILKTLLTSHSERMVNEAEVLNSGSESPETLISEPEISSFHVETVLSEPDGGDIAEGENEVDVADEDDSQTNVPEVVDFESDHEFEMAHGNEKANIDEVERNDTLSVDMEDQIKSPNEDNEDVEENEMNGAISDRDETNIEINDEEHNDGQIENDREEDEEAHSEVQDPDEVLKIDYEPRNGDEGNGELDEDDIPLAPIVEINEDGPNEMETNNSFEEEESATLNEPTESAEDNVEEETTYITSTQRDFIQKYRDIIEQINTKKCKCCDKTHPRRKAVIQHLQKNGHKVPKHTCYNCVITFSHIGALLSHMRANVCTNLWKMIYQMEDGIPDEMVIDGAELAAEHALHKVQYKDILNARSYACKLCPTKFQLKQFILKHVLDVHEDGQAKIPLACVHCGYRFKENRLWKKHIRNGECTVHIACDLCPAKFISMLDFNEHALAVHAGGFVDQNNDSQSKCVDGRPTDCPLCNKNISSYQNLVKHLKAAHNEEKPHYCQNCDAKFELISELNQHIYLEHSNRSAVNQSAPDLSIVKEETEEYHYSCNECSGIFETVDAWTDHQVSEHGQVAHQCDQCEKKFLQPSELDDHKNTHLKIKFYSCSYCANSYSSPQRLSNHVTTAHPGQTPNSQSSDSQFFCNICVRSFKSRQAYSNHTRIHAKVPTTNRKPGQGKTSAGNSPIPKISKSFSQSYPQNFLPIKQAYSNIPNAPYSCDICGKGFMHKKNIWKHKKILHADMIPSKDFDLSEDNTMQTNASTEGEEEYGNNVNNGVGLSIPQFDSFTSANFENIGGIPISNEALIYQCELCNKKFSAKTSLLSHKRVKHGIINASENTEGSSRSSCTICKISFTDKKSYYRHRKNVHKTNVQMCKICGKPLNSTLELYEHLKAAHAREFLGYKTHPSSSKSQSEPQTSKSAELEERTDHSDSINPDYQARYPCDSCGKYFLGMLALQNHQCVHRGDTVQPERYNCEICQKSYTSISALKSHRGWHLRSPDGKAAANNSGLWMPQNKVTNKSSKHEVTDITPPIRFHHSTPNTFLPTKRKFPPEVEVTLVNASKKIRSEEGLNPGEGAAAQLQALASGASSLAGDDRYCAACDKEFTKRAAYQRHMEEVHQPNSVFCPVCSKSFTRKSTLLVHMRKHYEGEDGSGMPAGIPIANAMPVLGEAESGGEPELAYRCDLCGVRYRSAKALGLHRARHHGEDEPEEEREAPAPAYAPPGEFTCAQCGEGVATPRDLLAHRQMHSQPSKFFCHICQVYFARAVDLSSHTRARHSDNDKVFFPCAMCERFYMNKKSLQRHIEMAH